MKKAVVLLSGGVDSATVLAIARQEGFDLFALSFDYGQRHSVELDSARTTAAHFNARKHLVINFNLRDIGGSALTSGMEVPRKSAEVPKCGSSEGHKPGSGEAGKRGSAHIPAHDSSIPVTYVPARNTIFLSFALSWAETLGTGSIFIGANAVDYSGYPDCRPEFIRAFEDMANLATKVSVEGDIRFRIQAPLIAMSKADIIRKGTELGVDYAQTWSCYDPVTREGGCHPCMSCDSCLIRAKGFRDAGLTDPLIMHN